MADLDLKGFHKKEKLTKSLNKTLDKIRKSIGGNPTVLWTGNDYHIYQPVSGLLLEEYETFYEDIIRLSLEKLKEENKGLHDMVVESKKSKYI